MTGDDFNLSTTSDEKRRMVFSGSDLILPCEEDFEKIEDIEEIPDTEKGEVLAIYTGSEDIHPEKEKLPEQLKGSDIELHAPISAVRESESFFKENRAILDIYLHIDRELKGQKRHEVKEKVLEMESPEEIKFFHHFEKGTEENLLPQQLTALLPHNRLDIILARKTEENVEKSIKLADKILTIARRRRMGIGWNIPEPNKNKSMVKEFFGNRNKDIVWLEC